MTDVTISETYLDITAHYYSPAADKFINTDPWVYLSETIDPYIHVDHHHLIPTRNLNYLIPHSNTQYQSNSYFPEQYVSGIRFQAQYRRAQA